MATLFDPIEIKGLRLKNRIMMSPMCQYQAHQGDATPTNWHFIHYVSRAIGGTGLVCIEMTNVEPRGRITDQCLGLWSEEQVPSYRRIVDECHKYGAKVGVQIGHAGRKSVIAGGDIVAPSAIPFSDQSVVPRELATGEVEDILQKFSQSAELAVQAGFDTIELHAGHGYLIHQFMSAASNHRTDIYGDLSKFACDVIRAVKAQMTPDMPLIMRVSAVEYRDVGYGFSHMQHLLPSFVEAGVDIFDISTGGDGPKRPPVYPAYQLRYAREVKRQLGLPVVNVGALHDPLVAEYAVREEAADIVAIGKGMLKNPYWAKTAAAILGYECSVPGVYEQGFLI